MANFNGFEDVLGAGGAIGGGYLAIKAGQGLLKRKLERDAKYDGMASDLDYQSNIREANAIEDPSERNATLTKLRRDYDDRKWQLNARQNAGEVGGKVALGGLGAATGYGIGKSLLNHGAKVIQSPSLGDAAHETFSGGLLNNFSRADFSSNPIHRLLAKTGAAVGALSGYQDADKKYWEGRKEIEYISDPEERANRLREYDSLNSKLSRAGETLKNSAIRAGIGAGIGYVGSKAAGHIFGERPQLPPQTQIQTTTKMSKKIRKAANFAPLPRSVALGANIGSGLGLLSGLGVGESQEEKDNTTALGRVGKVLGKTVVGSGIGAAAGYGYDKLKRNQNNGLNSRDSRNLSKDTEEAFNKLKEPTTVTATQDPDPNYIKNIEAANNAKWDNYTAQRKVKRESPFKKAFNYLNKDVKDVGRDVYRGYVSTRRNLGLYNKTMRKSANFQDPATIQRLIQKGSTYIPQPTEGVVTLDTALKTKIRKKAKYPQLDTNMGVKEINSMIESGKPVGKYFNKSVRKSALFQQRGLKTAEFEGIYIGRRQGLLETAGGLISNPIGKAIESAGRNTHGGWLGKASNTITAALPFGLGQKAKATLHKGNSQEGLGRYLQTKEGRERTAIGTGALLAGGGLLAYNALNKKPKPAEEEQ